MVNLFVDDSGPGEPRACAVCQGLSSSLSRERERDVSCSFVINAKKKKTKMTVINISLKSFQSLFKIILALALFKYKLSLRTPRHGKKKNLLILLPGQGSAKRFPRQPHDTAEMVKIEINELL